MTKNNVKMVKVSIGDLVELRKSHPCGSFEWTVYRVGADIGLRCSGCERTVLLSRGVFNKRVKRIIPPDSNQDSESAFIGSEAPEDQKHTEE